jgi:hypothetical protein
MSSRFKGSTCLFEANAGILLRIGIGLNEEQANCNRCREDSRCEGYVSLDAMRFGQPCKDYPNCQYDPRVQGVLAENSKLQEYLSRQVLPPSERSLRPTG